MNFGIGTTKAAAEEAEQFEIIIAPFLPCKIRNELCSGRRFSEYRDRRLEIYRARIHHAIAQQRLLGQINAQREMRAIGGGAIRHVMSVVPELEMACRLKYGRQCWQDPDFRKDTLKKTPEARVPEPKRRAFPVNGFRDSRRSDDVITYEQTGGAEHGMQGDPAAAVSGSETGDDSRGSVSAHEISAPNNFHVEQKGTANES